MSQTKYECNDCGHKFVGDDFTTECPTCNSNNLSIDKKSGGVNRKMLLIVGGIAIIAIIIFILVNRSKNTQDDLNIIENNEEEVSYDYEEEETEVDLYSVILEKNEEEPNSFKIEIKDEEGFELTEFITQITNTITNNPIYFKEGMIYPCNSDSGFINIKIDFRAGYTSLEEPITIKLDGEPNSKAKCPLKLEGKFFKLEYKEFCTLQLTLDEEELLKNNLKGKIDIDKVKLSLNGEDGDFSNKLLWEHTSGDNYSIYIQYDNDIKVALPEKKYPNPNCLSKKDASKEKDLLKNELKSLVMAANQYGNDPTNKKHLADLHKILMKSKLTGNKLPNISLDSKQLDFSEFTNLAQREFVADGTKFSLLVNPEFKNGTYQIKFKRVK